MNKKIIAIMLSVILVLALTTSCGKKSTTPFTITSTTPATSVQTTTSKPPTSTSLTGAPTSSTPIISTANTPTTSKTGAGTGAGTGKTTTITATSMQPTTSTSAPPSSTGDSIFDILGRATAVTTVEYDMVITAPDTSSTSHVWMKGKKMRMETNSGGQNVIILIDNEARTSIIIMGTFAMSQNWAEQDTPTGQAEDIMSYKPVLLEDETLDGKLCSVIQYSYTPAGMGAVTAKAWIWKQYGFPIRVESTDSTGKKTAMNYKNIVIGGIIPDSTFAVPPGITIMSGFPTGIPTGIPGM